MSLIGQEGGEGDAGVVVEGEVQVFPTSAPGFTGAISVDEMTGAHDAGQALDVEVDQVARMIMFIAPHGRGRVERAQA